VPFGNQRWRNRRASYRPRGEVIVPSQYDVAWLPNDQAKRFVLTHHYSRSYPAALRRFGLFRRGQLMGVAVFSRPCNDRTLTALFPCAPADALELGRFVLLDEVPGNGETWFLGQCFRALRVEGYYGVVAFSDPVPRHTAAGPLVFPGHLGTIYQAFNGRYLGRSRPRVLRLLPDGTTFSDRAASKIRAGARGWRYAARQLIGHGADAQAPFGPADFWAAAGKDPPRLGRREWLAYWLARLTRPLQHSGCHRYAWTLQKRRRSSFCPPTPTRSGRLADPTGILQARSAQGAGSPPDPMSWRRLSS